MSSYENPALEKLTSIQVKNEIQDNFCSSERLPNLGYSIHEEPPSDAELIENSTQVTNPQKNPNLENLISVEIKKQIEAGVFSFEKLLYLNSSIQVAQVKQEPVKSFNENQVKNDTEKTEPQPDIVPKTQPATRKRKHRKKQASTLAPEATVRKCEKWTSEEEVALARAWVDEPEEPKIDHWKRVREKFHNTMGRGEYRNPDMISSKWRETRLKVEKFEGIYKKNFNNRESETSDLNIFQDSCDEYKTEMGSAFVHNKVWEVVRSCTKWTNLSLMGQSSKRTKTSPSDKCTCQASSDDHCQNDFNDKDDGIETQEEQIHTPGSNNKGKRAASSNEPDYKQSLDNLLSKMSTFLELMREKQEYSDFKMLVANIDHLMGQDRELAEKMKQKVRDKYKK
ncbi:uncharacterized protein LOC143613810 [Bidens hawaiensis]|uniref:uncharacterized protein LOC143613810 n=1 Tax=Bidens hawaiensis TaxID=980011 RepID=UPI00404AE7AF